MSDKEIKGKDSFCKDSFFDLNARYKLSEIDFLSPRHLVGIFKRNWTFVCMAVILGMAVGAVWNTLLVKPTYNSRTSIFAGYDPSREARVDKDDDTMSSEQRQRQANSDAIIFTRMITLGMQLVGDYKELMVSNRVQNEVKNRVKNSLKQYGYPESSFKISADYAKTTRVIVINASSHSPLEAQIAARETAIVFKDVIEKILRVNNITIIDEASYPYLPTTTTRGIRMLIGGFLGFLLGFLIFFVIDYLDQTVKTPEDARIKLSSPVIGTIPMSEETIKSSKTQTRSNLGLIGFSEKNIAEAFRLVRTNLQYLVAPEADSARVFMVTSAVSGEGKSSCVSNLAMITAQTRKKVLVIDADLRKPQINKILDLDNSFGLVDILCGMKTRAEVVNKNVRNLPLDVILSGITPANPSELLMSKTFNRLIEEVRKDYDYVFIDAPPCMLIADPLITGQQCDGAIFVVSCGSTKVDAIRMSMLQLAQTNVNISGILLNKFSREHAGYGYYNYYNYYYYYSNYGSNEGRLNNYAIPDEVDSEKIEPTESPGEAKA